MIPERTRDVMERMRDEVESWIGWTPWSLGHEDMRIPRVNFQETDKEFVLSVELPGVEKENLMVEYDDRGVWISGKQETKIERKSKEHYEYKGKTMGFERYISLPVVAVVEKAESSYKDGLLTVKIPKREMKRKKLSVR